MTSGGPNTITKLNEILRPDFPSQTKGLEGEVKDENYFCDGIDFIIMSYANRKSR